MFNPIKKPTYFTAGQLTMITNHGDYEKHFRTLYSPGAEQTVQGFWSGGDQRKTRQEKTE